MENRIYTVKITGHLMFDSKHPNFRSAFKDFIESEAIQLQVTDMDDTNAPSMEMGVKLTACRDIVNVNSLRYAVVDDDKPQLRIKPKAEAKPILKTVPKIKIKQEKSVNSETGSDLAFY